jgi:hypothetical protein
MRGPTPDSEGTDVKNDLQREGRFKITVSDRAVGGGACGICYEFFTNLTSTTLAAKTVA